MSEIILVQEQPRGPSILVEIPVTAAVQKIKLPDVQQLRSQSGQRIIIKGIRLITAKVLAAGITVAGNNAPILELRNMVLTLYCQGWLKGTNIPILSLNDMVDSDNNNATTIPYRNTATKFDNWTNVDWSQSFLQFANGFTPTPPYVVMLDVDYAKINDMGEEIIGPS